MKTLHKPKSALQSHRAGLSLSQAMKAEQEYYYHDWKIKVRDLFRMPSGSMRLAVQLGVVMSKIMGVPTKQALGFLRSMVDVHCAFSTDSDEYFELMLSWTYEGDDDDWMHQEHVANFENTFFEEVHVYEEFNKEIVRAFIKDCIEVGNYEAALAFCRY